ncbi:MAG: hypothetical protein ACTHNZ_14785 [Trinickia sp.]|uniref:hypothetical protein n=1 Tax=Trinickia sp. TaxID=2571163 RepID=UPI003F7D4F81
MGFLVLPIMVVLFFIGLGMQMDQLAQAVTGAGRPGQMMNVATVTSQRMQTYAAACLDAATASPVISQNIAVILPAGAVAPQGASCMTTPGPSGARNVYAYAASKPGEAAQLMNDTYGSLAWYRVPAAGQAVMIATGQAAVVPATIPAGDMLEWVQVNP